MKWLRPPKKGFLSVLGTSPAGVFGSSPLTSSVAHSQIPKDVESALTRTHAAVSSGEQAVKYFNAVSKSSSMHGELLEHHFHMELPILFSGLVRLAVNTAFVCGETKYTFF